MPTAGVVEKKKIMRRTIGAWHFSARTGSVIVKETPGPAVCIAVTATRKTKPTMKINDFEPFEVITEDLRLVDKPDPVDHKPTRVRVVRDPKTMKAYQIDLKNHEYREAKHVLGDYGPWKKIE
jgi:hypothetical protein